jgi:nickel-dependent lactate racemase
MQEEKRKKSKDKIERKEFVRTNFGPEEDDNTYQAYRTMQERKKHEMRQGLLD